MREGGPLNLVYHGTMVARLGVDLLIQAVHRLQGRIPGLQLHLWGSGDDLDMVRALAQRLNLVDRVHFRPEGYPLEELPARLDAMDVGVVGNRRSVAGELMLPVKLLEYVALGIPVVAPRLKTIAHYFRDDMVSYFEPDDVDSMAEAIYRLHAQPGLRREQPSPRAWLPARLQLGAAGARTRVLLRAAARKRANWHRQPRWRPPIVTPGPAATCD